LEEERLEKDRIAKAVEENKAKVEEALAAEPTSVEPVETIGAAIPEWQDVAPVKKVKAELFKFKKQAA